MKRKVENFNYGNKIPEAEKVAKNFTEEESGRGFLPGKYLLWNSCAVGIKCLSILKSKF